MLLQDIIRFVSAVPRRERIILAGKVAIMKTDAGRISSSKQLDEFDQGAMPGSVVVVLGPREDMKNELE